jgi:hypothetical protein
MILNNLDIKKDEVIAGWKESNSEELHNFSAAFHQILLGWANQGQ